MMPSDEIQLVAHIVLVLGILALCAIVWALKTSVEALRPGRKEWDGEPGHRRIVDRPGYTVSSLLLGAATIGAGIILKHVDNVSDTFAIFLIGLGGVLVPGGKVLDAIRFWRRNGNGHGGRHDRRDPPEP